MTNSPAAPGPGGSSEDGPYGGRTLSGKVVVFAAIGLFLGLAAGVASFLLLEDGAAEVTVVRITELRVEGDVYVVSFDAEGFTPTANGAFLSFYWDGQNPGVVGVPYRGASPFTGLSIASAPPRSERICVALVTKSGEVNTGVGECKRAPQLRR